MENRLDRHYKRGCEEQFLTPLVKSGAEISKEVAKLSNKLISIIEDVVEDEILEPVLNLGLAAKQHPVLSNWESAKFGVKFWIPVIDIYAEEAMKLCHENHIEL